MLAETTAADQPTVVASGAAAPANAAHPTPVLQWLALAAIGVIGFTLHATRGNFKPWALLTLFVTALALAAGTFWRRDVLARRQVWLAALVGVTALELADMTARPLILYARNTVRIGGLDLILQWLTSFGLLAFFAVVAGRVTWVAGARKFGIAAVTLIFIRLVVLAVSPKPHIDVFASGMQGAHFLLQGLNPYAQKYSDIYSGVYGYAPTFFYGPAYLIWITPAWLMGDIRFSNVAAEGLTAIAMLRMMRGTRDVDSARWLVLVWLAFPVGLFVTEQAWVDSILLAALAWMWLALTRRHFALAGLAAGLALGVKQTAAIAVVLAVLWCSRAVGRSAMLRFAVSAALAATCCYLPFLLWNPAALWSSLVVTVLHTPARDDALTLNAWLMQDGAQGNANLFAMLGGVACALMGVWLLRRHRNMADLLAVSALAYFTVFLCGFQAFCNYYWLVAGILALTLAALARSDGPDDTETMEIS